VSAGLLSVSALDPDCLSEIGRAVAQAAPGTTITVRPGVYREELVFAADVTVVAEEGPGTVVVETSDGRGLLVSEGRVELRDIEFRGDDPQMPVIQVTGGTLRLQGCDVRAAAVAAVHLAGGELRVQGGSVRNLRGAGLVLDAGGARVVDCVISDVTGPAVVTTGDARAVFHGCTIRDVAVGAVLGGSTAAEFENCRLERVAGPGLLVRESARPRLQGVVVELAQVGLYVDGRAAPRLRACRFLGSTAHGVVLAEQGEPTLTDCVIGDSAVHGLRSGDRAGGHLVGCRVERSGAAGVVLDEDSTTAVTGGEIADCADAGVLVTGRSAPTITETLLRGNPIGVSIEGSAQPVLRSVRIRDAACGVHAVGGSGRLDDCEIIGAGSVAVRLGGAAELRLHGDRVRAGRFGVRVEGTATAVLTAVSVAGTEGTGLVVESGATARLEGCRFADGAAGLQWQPGSTGAVRDCRITGHHGVGVLVASSDGVTLADSTIRDNGDDLRLTVPPSTVTTSGLEVGAPVITPALADHRSADDGAGDGKAADDGAADDKAADDRAGDDRAGDDRAGDDRAADDGAGDDPVAGLLAEVDALVGQAGVKRDVALLLGLQRLARRRARAGLLAPPTPRHLVFAGPAGTGRRTVARLYGRALAGLGGLHRGHLIEVTEADLVDPADPTSGSAGRIQEARGGVLLVRTGTDGMAGTGSTAGRSAPEPPGPDVVAALLAVMDREDLVVIVTGTGAGIQALLAAHPAIGAAIGRIVTFTEFSGDELATMVERLARRHHYELGPGTWEALRVMFEAGPRAGGGVRSAESVFTRMLDRQAYRLAEAGVFDDSELARLQPEDLPDR
jgi:Right handed beta helix region